MNKTTGGRRIENGFGDQEACKEIQQILANQSFVEISSTSNELELGGDRSFRALNASSSPLSSSTSSSSPELEEPVSLRDSCGLRLVFCHSPGPVPNRSSNHDAPAVPTPPIRCSNPIIINSPFLSDDPRGSREGAEIGLLSVSPPPMDCDYDYTHRRDRVKHRLSKSGRPLKRKLNFDISTSEEHSDTTEDFSHSDTSEVEFAGSVIDPTVSSASAHCV